MGNDMLKIGRYRHYKGNEYEVVDIAKHSETLEELVVYRALYGSHDVWVRPLKMFIEEVEIGGKKVPRFEYIETVEKLQKYRHSVPQSRDQNLRR